MLVGPTSSLLHSFLDFDLPTLPIVKITSNLDSEAENPVEVTVVSYTDGMAFTSISHVWSGGIDNVNENKLPLSLTIGYMVLYKALTSISNSITNKILTIA